MRWNQIITEAVSTYRPMFASFYPEGIPPSIVQMIKKVEALMKRKDRIVWMLRWERFAELGFTLDISAPPEELAVAKKIQQKLMRDLADHPINVSLARNESDRAANMWDDFEHWFSLPIAGIQNYVFHKQLPSEINAEFMELEDEWKETRKRAIEHKSGDNWYKAPTKIIDFGNGWAWFDLEKSSCSEEGDAMGHCGNGAGSYNETVLSLRQNVGGNFWEPHVTFILDSDGYIGEMKGRNNEKPIEKYHGMIIALLKDDRVEGIKGGGYMPENNFSLDDLTAEEQKELKALKPGLRSISELANEGLIEDATKVAKRLISAKGLPDCDAFDKDGAVVSEYHSVATFANTEIDGYTEIFNNVERALDREENGDFMASSFREEYFLESLKHHIYDLLAFRAECHVKFGNSVNDPVKVCLNWADLDDALYDGEDSYHSVREALDETEDGHDRETRDYLDDIDESIMTVLADRKGSGVAFERLLDEIRAEYGGLGGSGWGSPTSRDPDQLGFDFGD
jgi:hypothetical protein